MKKRILALLLTAAMALSVAGCGSSDAPAKDANAQPTTQATEEKTEEKKEENTEAAAPAGGEEKDTFTIAAICLTPWLHTPAVRTTTLP